MHPNRERPRASEPKSESVRVVMDALRKIVRELRLSARAAERAAGIGGAQLFVLQALAREGVASVNTLAERVSADQSSVSTVVSRLVEQGLVARKASAADARRAELSLTRAGRARLRAAPEPTQARLVVSLERMAPRDLAALRRGLELLVGELGADEGAPMFFEPDGRRPAASRAGKRGRS